MQIKTCLRYPGGKSRAVKQIAQYISDFQEFREPFVGGGSLFIHLKQKYPTARFWINDLNPELYLFWKIAQSNLQQLLAEIYRIKKRHTDGKALFKELATADVGSLNEVERAVRFFVLNRTTYNGTIECGGYSESAFHTRFTYSSIERVEKLAELLDANVKITNLDYSELLSEGGERVALFLDPPYLKARDSKLYGQAGAGNLHTLFDHQRFALLMKECPHHWVITYDDSLPIRTLFDWAKITPWQLQYSMSAKVGDELIITPPENSQTGKI